MSDKIEEIRDRHSKRTETDHNGSYGLDGYSYPGTLTQSQRDLETALAEVERLRAEIDGLEAELALMKSGFEIAYREMGDKP